jgi:hypothetical protein
MPLLEVTQTRHVSASIRLTDATAIRIDQYVAFCKSQAPDNLVEADQIVEKAVIYAFGQDREFQQFLQSPEAQAVKPTLRIRKPAANEVAEPASKKPASAALPASQTPALAAGSKA